MSKTHKTNKKSQPTFEEVFTTHNLFKWGKKCCNGTRWKTSTQNFEMKMNTWVMNTHKALMKGKYKSKKYKTFYIKERGKMRKIQSVHISDRMVQKCYCEELLKPIIEPKLIYDNGANIKGKGVEFTLSRLKYHLTKHYKKYGTKGGILLLDWKNYFGSIPHNKILSILRGDIEDTKLYNLLEYFLSLFDGECGLGLGSEVSQILAVYYPNQIDHYIKEKLHIEGYGRYMDDSYIIHENIAYLKHCRDVVEKMSNELGLELNPNTHIVPLNNMFVFLKKRIHFTETGKVIMRLTKQNVKHMRRRLKKMLSHDYNVYQSLTSWEGYAGHYNTYETASRMKKDLYTYYYHIVPQKKLEQEERST